MSEYYWCFTHGTVEIGAVCRASGRLGPYESSEAARNWQERVEQREDAWKAEDERWEDDDSR